MIACGSKNLIYMIQCRQCENIPNTPAKYFRQTKRALRDRFGEHRRAIRRPYGNIPRKFNDRWSHEKRLMGHEIKIEFDL